MSTKAELIAAQLASAANVKNVWGNVIYNVKAYGAVGDGVTDDTAAIQSAITAGAGGRVIFPRGIYYWTGHLTIPASTTIEGVGYATHLKPFNTSGNTMTISGNNVVIRDLRMEGDTVGGISIKDGSDNILIEKCYFKSTVGELFTQVVWLFTCSNVVVQNCTFDNTGYGVIQENGYVSNNVKVINNTAKNMQNDFVELNCEALSPSKNWIITGNHFLGSSIYPTEGIEKRFVGVTNVRNLIITDNIVENVAGDAAIHLEGTGGKVLIEGNIFVNCRGTGYIYIMHDEKDVLINGNIFVSNDETNFTPFLYSASSDLDYPLTFTNNHCYGHSLLENVLRIQDNKTSNKIISNNRFVGFLTFMSPNQVCFVQFTNNYLEGAEGIILENSDSHFINDWIISDNVFNTTGRSLRITINTNGTLPPANLNVHGNKFFGSVSIQHAKSCLAYGNTVAAGQTFRVWNDFYGSNSISYGNLIEGSGPNTQDTGITGGYLTSISAVPDHVGQEALVAGIWYKAIANATTADWKAL